MRKHLAVLSLAALTIVPQTAIAAQDNAPTTVEYTCPTDLTGVSAEVRKRCELAQADALQAGNGMSPVVIAIPVALAVVAGIAIASDGDKPVSR